MLKGAYKKISRQTSENKDGGHNNCHTCLKMTVKDWLKSCKSHMLTCSNKYMGSPVWQNPLDLWTYQEIIFECKPQIIIEIGSLNGGTTLYLAHLLDALGKGQVISVAQDRSHFSVRHKRIAQITGNILARETIAKVSDLCRGKPVLIIQCGGFAQGQILMHLHAYSHLVTKNSYFIVEDTIDDFLSADIAGNMEAIETFLSDNTDFVVDSDKENTFLTFNPNGYLKKVADVCPIPDSVAYVKDSVLKQKFDSLVVQFNIFSRFLKHNMRRLTLSSMLTASVCGIDMYNIIKNMVKQSARDLNLKGACAVYGTGAYSEIIISALSEYNIVAIIERDSTKWGSSVLGVPVISIGKMDTYNIETVLIASISHREAIWKRLMWELKEKNVTIYHIPL